jgi:hypothetical protein
VFVTETTTITAATVVTLNITHLLDNILEAVGSGDVRRVSTGSAAGVEEGEGDIVDQDPCPDFQPVIPLRAEVELTTGEETVLFENRSKLFR